MNKTEQFSAKRKLLWSPSKDRVAQPAVKRCAQNIDRPDNQSAKRSDQDDLFARRYSWSIVRATYATPKQGERKLCRAPDPSLLQTSPKEVLDGLTRRSGIDPFKASHKQLKGFLMGIRSSEWVTLTRDPEIHHQLQDLWQSLVETEFPHVDGPTANHKDWRLFYLDLKEQTLSSWAKQIKHQHKRDRQAQVVLLSHPPPMPIRGKSRQARPRR